MTTPSATTPSAPTVDAVRAVIAGEPYFASLRLDARPPTGPDEGPYLVLPADEAHIGDATRASIHGGVVAAFLEASAVIVLRAQGDVSAHALVFTTDFVREARIVDTAARVAVVRRGRRLATVRVEAWQDHPDRLVAMATGTFALG